MGPGGRRVVKPTPRPAGMWELGSSLWLPVGFCEHGNLQHVFSTTGEAREFRMAVCTSVPPPLLCPRSSGPKEQEGRWGAHPVGEASTRPDQVLDSSRQHFTPT